MQHLLVSFHVVAPLLLLIALGVFLRRIRLIPEAGFTSMNQIVMSVALPALVFNNALTCDLDSIADGRYVAFHMGTLAVLFILMLLLVPLAVKDRRRTGVIIQALYRTNDAVYGLAIGAAVLDAHGMGLLSYTIALTIPAFNILGTMAVAMYAADTRPNIGTLLLRVIKNPIVIAALAGAVVRLIMELTGFVLPVALNKPIESVAAMSSPLAFITLGGLLSIKDVRKNARTLAAVTGLRLVVIPVAVLLVGYLLSLSNEQLVTALLVFGAPAALSSFPTACCYDCDTELAGELVAVTTAASFVTMFLAVTLLSALGVI